MSKGDPKLFLCAPLYFVDTEVSDMVSCMVHNTDIDIQVFRGHLKLVYVGVSERHCTPLTLMFPKGYNLWSQTDGCNIR